MPQAVRSLVSVALVAAGLGWLCGGLGLAAVVTSLVLVVLPLVMTGVSVLKNFQVELKDSSALTDPQLLVRRDELTVMGFSPIGWWKASTTPEATVLGMVKKTDEGYTYAAIYRSEGDERVYATDIVTILEEGRASLTTGDAKLGGVLPMPPGSFQQLLPGASTQELLQAHELGLETLVDHQIGRTGSEGEFASLVELGIERQSVWFRKSPLSNIFMTTWRVFTETSPHRAPLSDQGILDKQLSFFRAGRGVNVPAARVL